VIRAVTQTQEGVVAWFDATYRRKGARYLRPAWAYLVFPELLETKPGDVLLDVACGTGLLLRAARNYTARLHGIDISPVAVALARSHVPEGEILVGSAEALPYPAGSFDRITCLGSLERMLDVNRALDEMCRVGRERARYCFMVRNSNTRSWRYLAGLTARKRSESHAGADTLDNWRRLFESHRFHVLRILPDQYPIQRRRRWFGLAHGRIDCRFPIESRAPLERANEFIFVLEKS